MQPFFALCSPVHQLDYVTGAAALRRLRLSQCQGHYHMFIRRKKDWKQEYFYLAATERGKRAEPTSIRRYGNYGKLTVLPANKGKVFQTTTYIGKSLNVSKKRWEKVLEKAESLLPHKYDDANWTDEVQPDLIVKIEARAAVVRYLEKHGLPQSTAQNLFDIVDPEIQEAYEAIEAKKRSDHGTTETDTPKETEA